MVYSQRNCFIVLQPVQIYERAACTGSRTLGLCIHVHHEVWSQGMSAQHNSICTLPNSRFWLIFSSNQHQYFPALYNADLHPMSDLHKFRKLLRRGKWWYENHHLKLRAGKNTGRHRFCFFFCNVLCETLAKTRKNEYWASSSPQSFQCWIVDFTLYINGIDSCAVTPCHSKCSSGFNLEKVLMHFTPILAWILPHTCWIWPRFGLWWGQLPSSVCCSQALGYIHQWCIRIVCELDHYHAGMSKHVSHVCAVCVKPLQPSMVQNTHILGLCDVFYKLTTHVLHIAICWPSCAAVQSSMMPYHTSPWPKLNTFDSLETALSRPHNTFNRSVDGKIGSDSVSYQRRRTRSWPL